MVAEGPGSPKACASEDHREETLTLYDASKARSDAKDGGTAHQQLDASFPMERDGRGP